MSDIIDEVKSREIVVNYIKEKGWDHIDLSTVDANEKREQVEIPFGDQKGELDDLWTVSYAVNMDEFSTYYFAFVSATTGKLYGFVGSHGHRLP